MIRIEPADASLLTWIEQGDFSFAVEHVFAPCFDSAVSDHLAPVERYRKTYGSDLEECRDALADSQRALLAAKGASGWAGYLLVSENWNGYALVDDLGVESSYRRQGVARLLMDAAVSWAKARGLPGIRLETQDNNVPACLFYQRYGFQLGGIDRLLYSAQPETQRETALFWYLRFETTVRDAWGSEHEG
ncbi:GNAT family N-acetyltransferase [Pseudomonas sp. RIT-PI-AD]|uniref:GNAT family N-acetyltransferase n=1 Tax=Pseudomonas sp. RIT-PI-AD TaxID=3035294 RepID=UPI0021D90175|nr:GNAT family N-acetyltransferase [Pseudomonas sp. RIT-PI-AD]